MTATDRNIVRPVFIEGPSGPLFAIHHSSAEGRRSNGAVLYIPPFAEEMNRSRRMAALQARALASRGIDTLLLDLFGTGDSAGDFRDAELTSWFGDIMAAIAWLEQRGSALLCLWGLRFGALLACEAAARWPERIKRLILWQPVLDGKIMLTQFLRIRVAASMAESSVGEKTEDLRSRLAGGQSIEIAGYELSAELARALEDMRIRGLELASDIRIDWLEVGAEASDTAVPAAQRVIDAWRRDGIAVSAATVGGDPFWTLQETTLAPALIDATTNLFETCSVRPAKRP